MSPEAVGRAENAIKMAAMLLEDSTAGLTFEPDEHKYFINGTNVRCVSDVVQIFAPFNTEEKARSAAANPKHKYYGKTPEEIIALWEEKRDAAAAAGTQVHAFGEACFLYVLGHEDLIEDDMKSRLTSEGLIALTPKEEAVAHWWEEIDMTRYMPAFKETRIFNPILSYAGTFDLLLYDTVTDTFVMKDYKTNEDLFKWYGDMLATPLKMLKADDIGKYTVQQNLYNIALSNITIKISQLSLIWLKEDSTYMEVELPECNKLITYAVNTKNQDCYENLH